MLGFLIGAGCLIGLVHMIRRGPGGQGCCGPRHWGGWRARGCGGPGGFGHRALLRGLFLRLDTSPGQEKVILAAVEEVFQTGHQVHKEVRAAREALAEALRQPTVDAAKMAEARARIQGGIDRMSEVVEVSFRAIHEALDDKQRRLLADLIEEGHGCVGSWAGHPYRGEWV